MRNLHGIKPQDILLLLKLIITTDRQQKDLSNEISISQTEISHGFQRLKNSRLLTDDRKVNLEASIEFLVHGFKYVCPPEFGSFTAGIPTAYARPGFNFVKYSKDEIFVWPYPKGKERGIALIPFYQTLPQACLVDEDLYSLASLVEMIRIGRAREQKIASTELDSRIRKSS